MAPGPRVGSKLVVTGAVAAAQQELGRVALSGDGNTFIIGGNQDSAGKGAAQGLYAESNGVWTQQASKLLLTDKSGNGLFGSAVALSFSSNTAIIGGNADKRECRRGLGVPAKLAAAGPAGQQETNRNATDETGNGSFGVSVAVSSDGNTAVADSSNDNFGQWHRHGFSCRPPVFGVGSD